MLQFKCKNKSLKGCNSEIIWFRILIIKFIVKATIYLSSKRLETYDSAIVFELSATLIFWFSASVHKYYESNGKIIL